MVVGISNVVKVVGVITNLGVMITMSVLSNNNSNVLVLDYSLQK